MKLNFQPQFFFGRGTRKASCASVWVRKGKGELAVRVDGADLPLSEYFKSIPNRLDDIVHAISLLKVENQYNICCKVAGGGIQGQADALRLAIAKALSKIDENFRSILSFNKLLTTDSRKVESKKAGCYKARKGHTFKRR